MTTAIIAGIFGLAPLVLTYLSSRTQRLSLLEREIKVLDSLKEQPEAANALRRVVSNRVASYAERETRAQVRTPVERTLDHFLVAGVLLAYGVFMPLSLLFTDATLPGWISVRSLLLGTGFLALSLMLAGGLASLVFRDSLIRRFTRYLLAPAEFSLRMARGQTVSEAARPEPVSDQASPPPAQPPTPRTD